MPGSIYTHYTIMPSCYKGRSPQWPNDSDHLQDPKPAVSSRTWEFEQEEGWKQGEWRHLTLAGQGLEHTDILGTMALEVFYNFQVTTKVWCLQWQLWCPKCQGAFVPRCVAHLPAMAETLDFLLVCDKPKPRRGFLATLPKFQNDDPILLHHCPQHKNLRFALEYHYSPVKLTKAPVDSGAVDQGWEASRTAPKAIAHRRKAKGHVEVLSHARDVERPQVLWCVNDALDNTQTKHRIEWQHWGVRK